MVVVGRGARERAPARRAVGAGVCALLAWMVVPGAAFAQEGEGDKPEAPAVRSSVVALDDFTGIRLTPEAGFGWQLQELEPGDDDQTLRYGLGFEYQMEEMRVRAQVQHMLYERTYLGTGANLDGQGLQQVTVDEQAIHGEATFYYDIAEPLEVAWRDLALGLYGGLQARQLVNDVFPVTLMGVVTGAESSLWLARNLRFTANVDYTHNLGRMILDQETSSFGDTLGLMRFGGAVGLYFERDTMFSVGYQGTWMAMEKADFIESAVVMSLSMATPL